MQQLIADIRGRIDIVVVYKVDRLTHSLADFAQLIELFYAEGVSLVSVTQQFNTTSPMGRLTLNVLLSFAHFEREVTGKPIRDKIAASKNVAKVRGFSLSDSGFTAETDWLLEEDRFEPSVPLRYRSDSESRAVGEEPRALRQLPPDSGARAVSGPSHDPMRNRKLGRRAQGLVDDAKPLTHLDEPLHRRGVGVGVQFERQGNIGEADRRVAVHAECATRVPMGLGDNAPAPQVHGHGGGNRADGHAGTSDQRFQKHVRGAGQLPVPARGRVQTGGGLAAPRTHAAGNPIEVERRFGARRRTPSFGLLAILLFQRRLERAQLIRIHRLTPLLRP
jgi:hypothetical protein